MKWEHLLCLPNSCKDCMNASSTSAEGDLKPPPLAFWDIWSVVAMVTEEKCLRQFESSRMEMENKVKERQWDNDERFSIRQQKRKNYMVELKWKLLVRLYFSSKWVISKLKNTVSLLWIVPTCSQRSTQTMQAGRARGATAAFQFSVCHPHWRNGCSSLFHIFL